MRAHSPGFCIDRDDDGLRPERLRKLLDQRRAGERRGVHADLVRTCLQHGVGVLERADAAPEGEWDRDLLGDACGDVHGSDTRVDRRGDVEEDELVGARLRVGSAELHWMADIAKPLEPNSLDDAAVRDVEARDQTRERHCSSRKRAPAGPLFSGWNCTPRNAPCATTATSPSLVATAAGVSAAEECANQYAMPPGSPTAHPMRGTRPSRRRYARAGRRPSPATPPSSSVSSSAS